MSDAMRKGLTRAPRVLGILMALFLGLFALDAFSETAGFWSSLAAFLRHLTPTFMVLGVVYVAWNRPSFGAVVFLLFAGVYAITSLEHPSWMLAIAVPLATVGLAYLFSWRVMRPGPAG